MSLTAYTLIGGTPRHGKECEMTPEEKMLEQNGEHEHALSQLEVIANRLSFAKSDQIRGTLLQMAPRDVLIAIAGTEDGDGGFSGSDDQLRSVIAEMRRIGAESKNAAWSAAATEIEENMIG